MVSPVEETEADNEIGQVKETTMAKTDLGRKVPKLDALIHFESQLLIQAQ
jgi:hypothetical protein